MIIIVTAFVLICLMSYVIADDGLLVSSNTMNDRAMTLLDHRYDAENLVQRTDSICRDIWKRNYKERPNSIQGHAGHEEGADKGDILYIHVGKCAGGTIKKALLETHLNFFQVHLFSVIPEMVRNHSNIIIAMRDPVDRYKSAFYWGSPTAQLSNAAKLDGAAHHQFYSCFPNDDINEYVEMLVNTNDTCGQIARTGYNHLLWNNCAYMGGVLNELRRHGKVFLIETETLINDLNTVIPQISSSKKKTKSKKEHKIIFNQNNIPTTHARKNDEVPLSDKNRILLRGYLELTGEYALRRELRALSVNAQHRSVAA